MNTHFLKAVIISTALVQAAFAQTQSKYSFKSSTVSFFSDAPVEKIEAKNSQSKAVIDFSGKTFAIVVPIKSFEFQSDLMQEHFNENYLESDKFPNAIFKGKLTNEPDFSKDGVYKVEAVGDLQIHGKSKARTIPVEITVKGGVASLSSNFTVMLKDHAIEIPTLVFEKIAEEIKVSVQAQLGNL